MTKDDFYDWLTTVSIPGLFKVYNCHSHMFAYHMQDYPDEKLRERLERRKGGTDFIVSCSKFLVHEDTAIQMVLDCIEENKEEVEKFVQKNGLGEITLVSEYPYPIGEGYVKNTPRGKKYTMNRLVVVVVKTESNHIPLAVKTAYPDFSYEQIDDVWDDIDSWKDKKKE